MTPEGLIMFCGEQNNECYVYKVDEQLVLLTMLFIDDQESVIRNASFVDEQTIILSTESGKIYKFKYSENGETV